MPVYDADGNAVVELKMQNVKNKVTGVVEEKQVSKPVLSNRRFQRGVVSADGPLAPLIGWAVGQKQFLMERGQWPAGGLKHKCGAKAKDHTGTCCSTGLMYQQPDFQANASKLEELIRDAGHRCLFLPRSTLTLTLIMHPLLHTCMYACTHTCISYTHFIINFTSITS